MFQCLGFNDSNVNLRPVFTIKKEEKEKTKGK